MTETAPRKTLGLKKTLTLNRSTSNFDKNGRATIHVEIRKKRIVVPDTNNNESPAPLSTDAVQKIRLLQEAQAKQPEKVIVPPVEATKQTAPVQSVQEVTKAEEQEVLTVKPAPKKETTDKGDKEIFSRKKQQEMVIQEEKAFRKKSSYEERRSSGKVNLNHFTGDEDDDDFSDGTRRPRRSLASIKRAREKERLKHQEQLKSNEKVVREVIIPDTISVQELANRMSEKGANVVKELMKLGLMVTVTQTIDADTAQIVAEEFGHQVRRVSDADVEEVLKHAPVDEKDKKTRAPVVTVMGHVDHGKTSLLDALRSAHVAASESGGITQHIGAYQIMTKKGHPITFIDTPGHEAFTAMRARGAKVTDIVVLVVAANDGVMPQTVEAIHHAKAAGVPIIVAINKIDVQGANPQKVRTELLQHDVVVESMGGEVLEVEVSAKEKRNLDKLLEAILLQAEVLDLKAPFDCSATGTVIEAKMDRGRGSVATVLIQAGTLKIGDVFIVGQHWGRVRSLFNDKGKKVGEASVSYPIEVVGLQGTPSAGDDFIVVKDEAQAREIAGYREKKSREALQVKRRTPTENLLDKIKSGEMKELPVIIKADVQGSLEALQGLLNKIVTTEIKIRILHTAVGGINETDVTLAYASKAIIIGFNVRANPGAREQARRDGVDIRYYSIIYDVADDMKKAVEGMLSPELREKILGYAEVRQVISISKVGKVAGCMVTEGLLKRSGKARIIRDDKVIFDGAIGQLKRFKDDVKEVKESFECGLSFDNFDDIKVGDRIECYEIEKIAVSFESAQQKEKQ